MKGGNEIFMVLRVGINWIERGLLGSNEIRTIGHEILSGILEDNCLLVPNTPESRPLS